MKTVAEKLHPPIPPKESHSLWKALLLCILLIVLVFFFFHPMRIFSKRFVEKGDQFLLQKKYVSAGLQYEKALMLNSKYKTAKEHLELANNAQTDVSALLSFYKEKNATEEISKFDLANSFPENENAALTTAKNLIEDGEYQLALIPAETATEMSPNYDTAWKYLQIANLRISQMSELTPEHQNNFAQEADKIKQTKLSEYNKDSEKSTN